MPTQPLLIPAGEALLQCAFVFVEVKMADD
jgi:hypothetical protein